ncbi:MAG: hypothetical protein CMH41_00970 [Micrococcales bacterium]|jgi:hypothetical protein|nr:hypothetical protein [Micrococcales bacterium]
MTLHHSEDTHRQLVDRLPEATGKQISEWFLIVEAGPGLSRFDERVNWLRGEYDLSHGQATAIVHEYDKTKAARKLS